LAVNRVPLSSEPISGSATVAEYDKYAGTYMLPEYQYFVHKILRQGTRTGKVLDVGTGSGRLAIQLAGAKGTDFDITALDISKSMLQAARINAKKAGVEDKIKFVLASASSLPFADASFDLVVSYASLHHWLQPEQVINEIQRVVKPGGTVIIRDNRRIYGDKAWEFLVWLITRFMSKARRDNWHKVILSSYTIPEVKDILKKTNLQDYTVKRDFVKFDISVETRRQKGR
jgi:ubiquinone/menaquinone biosynthesis C-methylase UbiE